jgi:hypothetical protein
LQTHFYYWDYIAERKTGANGTRQRYTLSASIRQQQIIDIYFSGTPEGNYFKSCGKKYFISTVKVLLIFIIDGVENFEVNF